MAPVCPASSRVPAVPTAHLERIAKRDNTTMNPGLDPSGCCYTRNFRADVVLPMQSRLFAFFGSLAGVLGLSTTVAAMSFLPGCSVPQAHGVARPLTRSSFYADQILIKKSQRRLYLMREGKPIRTYMVSLGISPVGHKQRRGDNKTPEGRYFIDARNPNSHFTKALHISYPSSEDRRQAARYGWDPGGMIMIHGEPRSRRNGELQELIRGEDWTQGCIAVSNLAIDEIWQYTRQGIPVVIEP